MSKLNKEIEQTTTAETPVKETFGEKIKQIFNPTGVRREMLRYKTNKASFLLAMLALCLGIAAFCTVYGYIMVIDRLTGIDILINIVLMLFIFLSAENMKAYRKTWGYVSMGIGLFQIAHIFIYPMQLFLRTISETETIKVLDSGRFSITVVLHILAAASLIIAGVIAVVRSTQLQSLLKEKGTKVR